MRSCLTGLVLMVTLFPATAQERVEFITAGTCVEIPDTGDLIEAGVPTRFEPATATYTTDGSLLLPGFVEIDALHKLDDPGQWLFSVENGLSITNDPQDPLAIAVGQSVDPRDVIRFDGDASFTRFFCGEHVTPKIPNNCNVDAVMLDGNALILSLDAGLPTGTFLASENIERTDLIRYEPTGESCRVGTPDAPVPDDEDCCGKWEFVGIEFDATGRIQTQAGQATSGANVVGVSRFGTDLVISLEGPSLLSPSDRPSDQFLTGELAAWNDRLFRTFDTLTGWPTNVEVNGLTLRPPACPAIVLAQPADPSDQRVDLCGATWRTDSGVARLRLEWLPEAGATSYNVYVGSLDELRDEEPSDGQPDAGYGFCRTRNVDDTFLEIFDEAGLPALYYLITASFGTIEGGLGSACLAPCNAEIPILTERVNSQPPDCP